MAKAGKNNTTSRKPPGQPVNDISSPEPINKRISWDIKTKHTVVLFLLSFLLYANTIHHGFVLDDTSVIQQNMLVRQGVSGIPEILHTPYHYGYVAPIPGEKLNDLYRPLSLALFAIEFQLNGDNPLMGHLVNLLLYALCVVLLYRFLTRIFRDPLLPFVACLLFAVHPIHTEVVANIKSSDELLCFLFAFLSLSRLLSYIDTGKILSLVLSVFCFFLSLLSKETAITLLGIYPFIYLFYQAQNKRRSFIAFALFVLTAIVYLSIRVAVLKHYDSFNPSAIKFIDNQLIAAPGISRYATPILVLGWYLKLLFIPYPLICDYSYQAVPFVGFTDVWVIFSLVVYGVLAVWTILRLWRKKFDVMTFGMLFYLVTISVFSNLFLLIGSIMSERFLFFPSAGFCIVISALMIKLLNKKKESTAERPSKLLPGTKLGFPLVIICLVFGVITVQRNEEWRDNTTLYEADCAKSPQNYRLLLFLSGVKVIDVNNNNYPPQVKQEKYREIIGLLQKSISVYPESSESLAALADAYLDLDKFDSAIYYGSMAMKYTSYSWLALDAIAVGSIQTGRQEDARQVLRYALSVAPDNPEISGNMGSSFMETKQYDSAIHYLRISYAIAPGLTETNMLLSEAFRAIGQNDSALKYERQTHRN